MESGCGLEITTEVFLKCNYLFVNVEIFTVKTFIIDEKINIITFWMNISTL